MKNKNEQMYILHIKIKGEYIKYGFGQMCYMRELLFNYLIKHDMYGSEEVEFKIERFIKEDYER